MRVRVAAHDPAWRCAFREEADRIKCVIRENFVSIHHIGSTAVSGIYAKPIIDILLQVVDIDWLDDHREAMERLGYEALGTFGIPGRRYFRKYDAAGIRTHQVHAFESGHEEIERHLAFRDYLIDHPEVAQAYSALKQELARKHPDDYEAYMDGKDPFIKMHEARALAWREKVEP